ncbi:DUF5777 family beta-barrel protein [Flaviramulus sp. BrNp1-15]|uniref:DUF5777 family beta-barrel protein n=1 Tax=Flaviramulus sp. BrNp1-15 TaxID=2916754 RepID=UPI001EE93B3A|nr:DUF5777 family beta-barrel protein [Flaviramulus sp. BrNp1-15]ULC59879.1 DUF5777 family beta-barrel protein [Flaviramulus sp. BrNp1-15]
MKIKKALFTGLLLLGSIHFSVSQDLLDILENEQKDTTGYITPSFKMTRIAFGHSTEVRSKNILEVFTSTRFWDLPRERSQSFGADKMSTRIALEYGISNRLSFAVGGTTFDGLFDSYLKYKLLTQKKGAKSAPFNITLFQGASYNSSSISSYYAVENDFSNRLSFTSQILISRKFSSDFSFQIAPTFIHKGLMLSDEDKPNFFAMGFGARYKLGPHLSIVSEYYKTFNPIKSADTYGPFALGVNWEVGDVLLQFMLTNARDMVEDTFITQTRNNFNFRNPNLNFGFNATYVIHFKNSLKKK